MSIPDDAPVPRLCHVLKWEDFDGYGFNLHTDKSRPGQYIGKVDEGSPAEAAGLKQGDRIIEVNGVNIANENHRQVVQRIKTIPDETRLLVVDTDTDDYYKSRNIVVKGTQSNIKYRKSPPTSAGLDETEESDDDKKSHLSSNTDSTAPQADEAVHKADVCNGEVPQQCESPEPSVEEAEQEREQTSPSVEQTSNEEPSIEGNGETEETSNAKTEEEDKQEKEPEEKIERRVEPPVVIEVTEPEVEKKELEVEKEPEIEKKEPEVESPEKKSPTPPESPVSSRDSSSPVSNGAVPEDVAPVRNGTGLNLNMTAAEMKAMLAQKKKRDPKKDNMDLRMKYKIVQSM